MSLVRHWFAWTAVACNSVWAIALVRTPYLQNVQSDRVSILWTAREPGNGIVTVTPENGTPVSVTATTSSYRPADFDIDYPAFVQFRADFTGLRPGTWHSYRVTVDGAGVASDPAVYRFRTAGTGKFSLLAFGDSGEGTPQQDALAKLMMAEPDISFAVHTGDLSYPQGDFVTYDQYYFRPYAPLMARVPFFPTPGNHDYMAAAGAMYLAVHAVPTGSVPMQDRGRYYSFDWGDAHFVSLDSNSFLDPQWQRMSDWLRNDLERTTKYWRVVYFHHPPYPTGHHRDDELCEFARTQLDPILEQYGVQLVLGGHEHSYQRTYPLRADERVASGPSTTYVITAGGGAALQGIGLRPQTAVSLAGYHYVRVDVDGPRMTIRAIGERGDIDRFTLSPEPGLAKDGVVSAADYSPGIAPGSLISIFGQNFGIQPAAPAAFPLPSDLGGVQVAAGGKQVPLLFVSPRQINCQIPYSASGQTTLEITTPNGKTSTTIQVAKTAPAILAVVSGAARVSGDHPAAPGSVLVAYATGLGPVIGSVAEGHAAPLSPLSVAEPAQVLVGQTAIVPIFAGLSPGFAGLYQVNFRLPDELDTDTYAVRIKSAGITSRPVPLAVKKQ